MNKEYCEVSSSPTLVQEVNKGVEPGLPEGVDGREMCATGSDNVFGADLFSDLQTDS
jgi:hypothetical protein